MLKWKKDKCWLPSCGKELDPRSCQRHHWDFMGKLEDPWCYPEVIHLFCSYSCHDRTHKIAALIVAHLENYNYVLNREDLIESVAFILNEPRENVEFVLEDEFVPAGITVLENEDSRLVWRQAYRIFNIKKYLLLRNPGMAFQLGIRVDYN